MSKITVLLAAPMVKVARTVPVTGGTSGPWRSGRAESVLDPGTFATARAARKAGAEVVCVLAADSSSIDTIRAELSAIGATADLLETASAGLRHTTYVGEDGDARFEVVEGEPPSFADVDRLLDRVGRRLEDEPDIVVVGGDLDGGPRLDFSERVVGRAWGLGVRTVLVPNGAALKQAFHTEPLAAWVEAGELTAVSPPDEGVTETEEETLRRIFLDSVRLLFVRREDGSVFAAARAGNRECGRPDDWNPGAALGALAAFLPKHGEDYLAAAEEAYTIVTRTDAPQPTA